MIEAGSLTVWNGLVGSAALLAIIILALAIMVGAIKRDDVLRHLGDIVVVLIILIMLPAIIVSLWESMSLAEHVGLATIVILTIALLIAVKRKSKKASH